MKELTYTAAVKALTGGTDVYMLPDGLNPWYLAIGVQKINPIAAHVHGEVIVPAKREWMGGPGRLETRRNRTTAEARVVLRLARGAILEECWYEPGSSHTKVRYYTID